ncbi:MAG TPA: CAP domain-containing protein [Pyrinomonadaceae bacterium]|nr:CAP domain-containing protein [Pyrinomonadaceae bacterium]
MNPGSTPLRAARKRATRSIVFGLSLLLIPAASQAKNTTTKTGERPVARLISASRQEVPARARARAVAVPSARPSYAAGAASTPAVATADERRAFDLVNSERARRGLRPLVWDGSLARVARYHSDNMAGEGFFNHVDRDGLDISGRAELLGLRGWRALGENIAYNQGYDDPTAFAVERWMISSKHRENILSGEFTHAGLGVTRARDGRIFFTQVFMRR